MISLDALRARQPKELLQSDVYQAVPPEDLAPQDLEELASNSVLIDPAKVLQVYRKHVMSDDQPDVAVLVRAFTQLGFIFDPNSFYSTADRQILITHKHFRQLAHDLVEARLDLPTEVAPLLIYAMSCLEYRCGPLLATLLDIVESHVHLWRPEILTLILHSCASLGLTSGVRIEFDLQDRGRTRDYSHVSRLLLEELIRRLDFPEACNQMSTQDWARACFAAVMTDLYDVPCGEGFALPVLVTAACEHIEKLEDLETSGWAQFFLYQTLYCVDVEKPACEEAVKRAMPMWIQEKLHMRWLDSVVLHAQPQGADTMQVEVDAALKRTGTQASLNCSVGRDWDEQHCWFAGFLLNPKIALECDSMLPLGPGRPLPSGWLALKVRVLQKMGHKAVTIHRCFWDKLSEDQKDEQILYLRSQVGYRHDKERAKQERPVRQEPHIYKGMERKESDWRPLPSPPSE